MPPSPAHAARFSSLPWPPAAAEDPSGAPAAHRPWPPARAQAQGRMRVTVVEHGEDLAAHAGAWQALAAESIERNAFYEPWLLLPAIARLGDGRRLLFVLIHEVDAQDAPRLCGFFPLELQTRLRGLPVRVLRTWKHLHCFFCVPLIRAERADAVIGALFAWARDGADAVELDFVSGDGPLQRVLVEGIAEADRPACTRSAFTRALWRRRDCDVATYLQGMLSGGVRKEYRRQRRRLEELGKLEFRRMPAQGDAGWLHRFLALEAGGWKGREGSAIALHDAQRAFVEEAVAAGLPAGRIVAHGLFLDRHPVAMLLSFRSDDTLFMFKIAYDEAYAKYSPGVQLMLDVLAELHADPGIRWLDSCAVPAHPMIERLLGDRRILQTLLVSTGTWRGDLAVSALPLMRWAARLARRASGRPRTPPARP